MQSTEHHRRFLSTDGQFTLLFIFEGGEMVILETQLYDSSGGDLEVAIRDGVIYSSAV